MKFIKNDYKEYFKSILEKFEGYTEKLYAEGYGKLFTPKELEKLKFLSEVDEINEYTYVVMRPTADRAIAFCENVFFTETPEHKNVISQLISNKVFSHGKNKTRSQDRGSIEMLKDNLKQYVELPKSLPSRTIKKKKAFKKVAKTTEIKPKVYVTEETMLSKPNQATWNAVNGLERIYATLIKANIFPRIDNVNPTESYSDRHHVTIWDEILKYLNAEVILEKEDLKIRTKATELTEQFASMVNQKDTALVAEIRKRQLTRKLTAFKGSITKAVNKQAQILKEVDEFGFVLEDKLTKTDPIVLPKPFEKKNK